MWEALLIITQVGIFWLLLCGAYEYIRLRRRVRMWTRNMDCDELIDQLLKESGGADSVAPANAAAQGLAVTPAWNSSAQGHKRERLAALAVGGQARQYLGRALTAEEVDAMSDEEIAKLYGRYEARLGAAMTKTLGQAALQLYSWVTGMVLPIPPENQPKLVADLEADPFVSHALSGAMCELYHRYGTMLAPLTAALTTARHCRFGQACQHVTANDDGRTDSACPGESETVCPGENNGSAGGD